MGSASGVVGPFAASTSTLPPNDAATSAVITPSSAAGMASSHPIEKSDPGSIASASGKPATVPTRPKCSASEAGSIPPGLWIAPPTSATATTRTPSDERRKTSGAPTLP